MIQIHLNIFTADSFIHSSNSNFRSHFSFYFPGCSTFFHNEKGKFPIYISVLSSIKERPNNYNHFFCFNCINYLKKINKLFPLFKRQYIYLIKI